MPSIDPALLQNLEGPDLMDAAEEFAISEDQADLGLLATEMVRPGFLDRLDPGEAYEGQPKTLAIARIIRVIADNPAASALSVLVTLTQDSGLTARWQCNELLIMALVDFRPAQPEVVSYWQRHSQPDALHKHTTLQAICQNASAPAMPLLHGAITNQQHVQQDRVAWMRDPILTNRNEPEILETCETMLTQTLEPQLRPMLVEGLYDHQPLLWFRSCSPPQPPALDKWTDIGRAKYWQLGKLIIANFPITDDLKQKVQASMDALGKN
jgi:hypothetical protein